jgi:uncharacterized protein (DUF2249 family)
MMNTRAERPEAKPPSDIDLDVRGLMPPAPLVQILEQLERLPRGCTFKARTDRRPVHLYDLLSARGYVSCTEDLPDGSFLVTIRHD